MRSLRANIPLTYFLFSLILSPISQVYYPRKEPDSMIRPRFFALSLVLSCALGTTATEYHWNNRPSGNLWWSDSRNWVDADGNPITWSLNSYREALSDAENEEPAQEAWDEIEKSIVASLAKDVIVGIKKDLVEMTIVAA